MPEDRKKAGNHLKRGKYIYNGPAVFGAYAGSPIEWSILDVSGGHMLLISREIVAERQYHETDDMRTSWKGCTLRKWLNGDFISSAFDREERAMIDSVETDAGCEDRVFLLSRQEVTDPDLFKDDDARKGGGMYWLRSLPGYGDMADAVSISGFITRADKNKGDVGVRPVIWVDLT